MATKIKVTVPNEQLERDDPREANALYLAAATWLREHTRDYKRFKILFDNLVSYDYRRNLLGVKPVAIAFNALVATAAALILWLQPPLFTRVEDLNEKLFGVLVAVVLHSAYMLLAVGAAPVREASRTHGRQLAISCESLIPTDFREAAKPGA